MLIIRMFGVILIYREMCNYNSSNAKKHLYTVLCNIDQYLNQI